MGKRINGEGSLFKQKRKNKEGKEYFIWVGQFTSKDGKKKRISGHRGESQGDLKKRLEQAIEDDKGLVNVVPTEVTVKQLSSAWLKTKRDISDETRPIYRHYIESYIDEHIGQIAIQKLDKNHVEDLFTVLMESGSVKTNKPLSAATIKKVKSLLVRIIDYAIEENYIRENFVRKIKTPRVTKTKINAVNTDDIKQIQEKVSSNWLFPIFMLDIATGLRRGELLGLRWQDVDLENDLITIQQQLVVSDGKAKIKDALKTDNAYRVIGIPKMVKPILEELKSLQEQNKQELDDYNNSGLVCQQPNGNHYHPRWFAKLVDRMFNEAGLDKRRVHDLRHSCATLLLSNGAYVNEVMELLGQADIKTTLGTYGHILPGRQKEIANKMDIILTEKPPE